MKSHNYESNSFIGLQSSINDLYTTDSLIAQKNTFSLVSWYLFANRGLVNNSSSDWILLDSQDPKFSTSSSMAFHT